MNWESFFRDHWLYKVGAVFIVFLLWLDLTAGERQSQEVVTRLIIDVQDSAWVLLEAPDAVATTFQGRNRDLLALIGDDPEVRIGIREVTGPVMRLALDPDQVVYDRELGVRATLVVPTSIELRFEQLAERRVLVVADLVTVPAMGFTVMRPLLVEPDSVTVRGAHRRSSRSGTWSRAGCRWRSSSMRSCGKCLWRCPPARGEWSSIPLACW